MLQTKDAFIQARLPEQLYKRVRKAAASKDQTVSEFVRTTLEQKLRALDAAHRRSA